MGKLLRMWPLSPHPTETENLALWKSRTQGLVPPHERVRFYPSVAIALSDLCRGLVGMYSNKKHVLRLKGLYRGYLNLGKGLSQEGALLQDIDFPKSLDIAEITAALKKETLCVLMASDSAWTAEVFPIAPLWQMLLEKKTFVINISSLPPSESAPWQAVGTHGIWIHEFPGGECVAILGSRFRASTGIYGTSQVPQLDFSWMRSAQVASEQVAAVQNLEKKYRSAGVPTLQPTRCVDRALLHFDDIDGSALRDLLIRQGGDVWIPELEAFSLCRWEDDGQFEDLLERGWSKDNLRGTLAVSAKILGPLFETALEQALAKLRALQSES